MVIRRHADLVFRGGRVVTMDARNRVASALAVAEGRIVDVGDGDDLDILIGPETRVVDLAGRTVLPGINDAHLHLSEFGLSVPPISVDLTTVRSLRQLQAELATGLTLLADGHWLIGSGWREANIPDS